MMVSRACAALCLALLAWSSCATKRERDTISQLEEQVVSMGEQLRTVSEDLESVTQRFRDFESDVFNRFDVQTNTRESLSEWTEAMQGRILSVERGMELLQRGLDRKVSCGTCRESFPAHLAPRWLPLARLRPRFYPRQGGGGSKTRFTGSRFGSRVNRTTISVVQGRRQNPHELDEDIEEAKLTTTILPTTLAPTVKRWTSECDRKLTDIKAVKTVKKSGQLHGSWLRDSITNKVYLLSGTASKEIIEFNTMKVFVGTSSRPPPRTIELEVGWKGTGNAVNNGTFYASENDTVAKIARIDIRTGVVLRRVPLPDALPPFELAPFTTVSLTIDENGLWAIYGSQAPIEQRHIVLAHLDNRSLAILDSWMTPCDSRDAQAAFIICGTLYVAYSEIDKTVVSCVFNPSNDKEIENMSLAFPYLFTSETHSSMLYNMREKQLYSWADGHQLLYKLQQGNQQ
uniref:olfactomedin-like protein 3A n=1 Tax=Myxine glutinosa TaxID=7769 RepID=UPI003590049A